MKTKTKIHDFTGANGYFISHALQNQKSCSARKKHRELLQLNLNRPARHPLVEWFANLFN